MADKPKTATATTKKKRSVATETSQSIEEQTRAFLAAGGEVTHINSGVSGQQSMAGPKHIYLGSKPHDK